MSARKLGRFAGLVFVLAVAVGGIAGPAASAEKPSGGAVAQNATTLTTMRLADTVWT